MSSATLDRTRATAWLQAYGVYLAVAVLLLFNLAFTENFLSAADCRTQRSQVVMHAHSVQLHLLSVQQEAFFSVECDGADSKWS